MTDRQIIAQAIREFNKATKDNPNLKIGRAIVPALPNNKYAVFYNGRFQTLANGSGDYYEGA